MLLLGLLLLGATAAFTSLLIADNLSGGTDYSVVLLGHSVATMNSLEIFLAGLALALIFCLTLAVTWAGALLYRRRTALIRQARREARQAASTSSAPKAAGAKSTPRLRRFMLGH
jgi:hypothetical protein